MDQTLILLGSGTLICLMPMAVYLLYLANLNGRPSPTLVSGPWDFAAVLLGLSGFLVLSGPLFITLVHSAWRSYLFGNWAALRAVGAREGLAFSLMSVGYLLVLGAVIALLVRMRRPVTAVYGVAADGVEESITGVLDELGYASRRANGLVEIGPKRLPESAEAAFDVATAMVRIDRFPSTRHATLRWGGDYLGIRQQVETILPRALTPAGRNPAAGWMLTAAVSVMVVMLLWVVVLIYIILVPPPN